MTTPAMFSPEIKGKEGRGGRFSLEPEVLAQRRGRA